MRWFWIYMAGVIVVIVGLLLVLQATGVLSSLPAAVIWGGVILIVGVGIVGAVGRTKPEQSDIDIDRG